jgi:uncharacterized protein (DUF362 family)
VAITRCDTYDAGKLSESVTTLMDQLGGFGPLVTGKTVTIKVNMVGDPTQPGGGRAANLGYHTHPAVVLALVGWLDRHGARRIRLVESAHHRIPIETFFTNGGWDIHALTAHRAKVEFENTRNLGSGSKYHEVKVPWGGSLFPAYLLNHSYVDTDLYISLAKLKNHATAGITLGMKNNFGITPNALYGQPKEDENSTEARVAIFHQGRENPAAGIPRELDPTAPRRTSYRVPRHTVDSVGIRPIDLTLIDGIETVSNGEGPWVGPMTPHSPHLLLAGRNVVCTDAVGTALMGYDPMAASGTGPFPGDNHLALAASLGLGTNDLKRIEVIGVPVAEAKCPYGWEPKERNL